MEPLQYQTPVVTTTIDVRSVASRQRAIILCILVNIVLLVCQFLLPVQVRPILALAYVAVVIVSVVFIFLLSTQLYGTGVGILLGILTLVPLIGLFVLLIVNGKATAVLKKHGIQVGLLGATIPPQ